MTTSPTASHRAGLTAAAWALLLSSGAAVLLCLAAAGFACWVIALDLSTRGEEWDGLGQFIGGLLLLVAVVLGVLSWGITWGVRRGLRTLREDGRAGLLAPTALVAAAVGWLVLAWVTSDTDPDAAFLVIRSVAGAVGLSGTLTLALSAPLVAAPPRCRS